MSQVACLRNEDCRSSGFCKLEGYCAAAEQAGDPCSNHSDCPTHLECNSTILRCQTEGYLPKTSCVQVTECSMKDFCRDEKCIPRLVLGEFCREETDCADGYICYNGRCATKCNMASHCALLGGCGTVYSGRSYGVCIFRTRILLGLLSSVTVLLIVVVISIRHRRRLRKEAAPVEAQ